VEGCKTQPTRLSGRSELLNARCLMRHCLNDITLPRLFAAHLRYATPRIVRWFTRSYAPFDEVSEITVRVPPVAYPRPFSPLPPHR
jgi:hypothetical protein